MLQFLLSLSDESGHGKIEHIFGKAKDMGESILMLHHRNKKGTRMGAVSVVEQG